ncbi:sigma 54-interacting transcriptional regulator, partial [bacterium]|nr:sigma 54-interacting transcriptional regulator [bacterium]
GDMSLAAQSKLLQVIENKRFKRIGGLSDISSDLWIIAATNKNLETESEKGLFRKDLLYRLNVLTLTIPPLRDRIKDIPLYINHFIDKFSLKMRKDIRGITEAAKHIHVQYNWPGNIRELRNVIERAVLLTSDGEQITTSLLPRISGSGSVVQGKHQHNNLINDFLNSGLGLTDYLKNIEKNILTKTFEDCNGNQAEAARRLNIPKHVIKYRMKKLRQDSEENKDTSIG